MNPLPDLTVPITVRIARLPNLQFDEIKSLWQRLFGKPAPTHNRPYLERRLAYRLQELEYAGLHPELLARNKERIDALVQQQSRKKRIRGELVRLVPGTVLTRDFLGVEYRVTTLPDGQYEYSLSDFARMVDLFDQNGVSFVSVTQQFNTTTSMGRLTLNILLSFAQFEREVTGERIRDKIAASKAKGMWMGGVPPLGYDVLDRRLIINYGEAKVVKRIFGRFLALGSTTDLVKELKVENVCAKSWTAQSGRVRIGKPIDKSLIYKMLNNPIYLGEIRHKDKTYPGAHEPIIARKIWDDVQTILAGNSRTRANQTRARSPALLRGIIFTADGRAMTPHHTRHRSGRMYRYYLSTRDNKEGYGASGVRMLPAGEVEEAVLAQLRANLRSPDMAAMVWQEVQKLGESMTDIEVSVALNRIDEIWEQLFPAEQARVVRLLVERVTVTPSELHVKMRPNGVEQMALEIGREMLVEECEAA